MVHQSQGAMDAMGLPTEKLGYSGVISRCAGLACPDVFHAPPFAAVGPDIHDNTVRRCSACMCVIGDNAPRHCFGNIAETAKYCRSQDSYPCMSLLL